jgi:hypothetical protein
MPQYDRPLSLISRYISAAATKIAAVNNATPLYAIKDNVIEGNKCALAAFE